MSTWLARCSLSTQNRLLSRSFLSWSWFLSISTRQTDIHLWMFWW